MADGGEEGDDGGHGHGDDGRLGGPAESLGKGESDGGEEGGGGGVGHELGEHGHDGEDDEQDDRRVPAADGLLEPAGHDVGGAALLHGGAERNGAGDEDVDFGVDGA